jgi:hypothetical protein
MPRTADRVADDESFGERTVVMRAVRPNRETFVAAPYDDDLIVADVAGHGHVVRELVEWNTSPEVKALAL